MDLRISSGIYRNKKLKVAKETKPVMERVKNAVFSVIGDKIVDANVLDLYAGSGNLSFESISRGAKSATLIEESFFPIGVIRENIENIITNEEDKQKIKVIKNDSVKFIVNDPEKYDIIFIDPPYEQSIKHILKFLHEILKPTGYAVYFHDKSNKIDVEETNKFLRMVETRIYSITQVDFIKLS